MISERGTPALRAHGDVKALWATLDPPCRTTTHGITAIGRLSVHSLRDGFASLLIAKGLNVVFVSRQLGHANPTVTLSTYAHLFEQADHAASARGALEAGYAATADAIAP